MKTRAIALSLCAALPLAAGAQVRPAAGPADTERGADAPVITETVQVQFDRLDADASGSLTLGEVPEDYVLYRDFARWDEDKDGLIDIREFDRYVDQLAQL